MIKIEEGEKTPIAYTVLSKEEIPKDIQSLIDRKKKSEFQITYQDGNDMYLIKGYGQQMGTGYSISIEELGENQTAIFFKTQLIGPKGEDYQMIPTYPCIVVKMKYQKSPIIFQ